MSVRSLVQDWHKKLTQISSIVLSGGYLSGGWWKRTECFRRSLLESCDSLSHDPCCLHLKQERGASRSPFTGFLTLLWNLQGHKGHLWWLIHFWVCGWSCVPGCHDIHTKLHGSHFSLLQRQNQKNSLCFPWGVWLSNDGGGGELTWAQFRKPTWMWQYSGVYSGNLLGVWELKGLKPAWWGSVIHVQGTWVRGHQKRVSILPSRASTYKELGQYLPNVRSHTHTHTRNQPC